MLGKFGLVVIMVEHTNQWLHKFGRQALDVKLAHGQPSHKGEANMNGLPLLSMVSTTMQQQIRQLTLRLALLHHNKWKLLR